MIAILIEILGEFFLQIALEALFEMGVHAFADPNRRPPNPLLAGIGYAIFGAVLGGLSLLALPTHLVVGGWRTFNLIASPIGAGFFMCLVGKWRAKRGEALMRIDRFSYGYLFALSFALIRFYFAK